MPSAELFFPISHTARTTQKMIYALAILSLAASASAFSARSASRTTSMRLSAVQMPETPTTPGPEEDIAAAAEQVQEAIKEVPKVAQRLKAQWFPFGNVMAPRQLDGSLPGDVGFDPVNISKDRKTLLYMREAEVKHARLAMLAAVGWPLSELYHKQLASVFGFPSILAAGDKAPSLMNGGLDAPFATGTLIISILLAGILESNAMNNGQVFWGAEKDEGYTPGDLGFDPLNMNSERNQLAEIKNGRLAMLAITAFAFQELASGLPVVQETPYLF